MPLKGHKHSKETKLKISLALKGKCGKKHSQETKRKIRISAIKYIENQKGQVTPRYNLNSQDFFRKFDKDNNTQGQYAENGGEFRIKELGYFLDYFNEDLKLIIEWDEKAHFNIDGTLKEKDVQRQKEIQDLYPDFKFKRIKE